MGGWRREGRAEEAEEAQDTEEAEEEGEEEEDKTSLWMAGFWMHQVKGWPGKNGEVDTQGG